VLIRKGQWLQKKAVAEGMVLSQWAVPSKWRALPFQDVRCRMGSAMPMGGAAISAAAGRGAGAAAAA
jgi:hypothetical protein